MNKVYTKRLILNLRISGSISNSQLSKSILKYVNDFLEDKPRNWTITMDDFQLLTVNKIEKEKL